MNTQTISMPSHQSNLAIIGGFSGILSIIFYVSAIALSNAIPEKIILIMAFTFPLLWIISFLGLYQLLQLESPTATLPIALIFGIIGSALACTLLVIQRANIIWHQEALAAVSEGQGEELIRAAYRGANRVQAGIDVAFDIFITIAWILFGFNIAKSQRFPSILGWSGSLLAAILLVFNMSTFPNAPAEAGLMDLGPFLGLWALIFYCWFTVVTLKNK